MKAFSIATMALIGRFPALVLIILCCIGIIYCMYNIIAKICEFVKYFAMFQFITKAFNIQYKVLRPFIESDMTASEILDEIRRKKPEAAELIGVDDEIYVVFTKKQEIGCENTEAIRNTFIMAVSLLEKLQEFLELHNIVFYDGIYDENKLFIKELRQIRMAKSEPTEYENKI